MITIEDFKLDYVLKVRNKFYLKCIKRIDFIKSVFKKFDGKQITKRIETALNKNNTDEPIYFCRRYGSYELYSYQPNSYQDRYDYLMFYDNKLNQIDYNVIVEKLDKQTNYWLDRIAEQEKMKDNLQNLIDKRNKIAEELESITEELRKINDSFKGSNFLSYEL